VNLHCFDVDPDLDPTCYLDADPDPDPNPDPDPHVFGALGSGSGSTVRGMVPDPVHQEKIVKKTLIPTVL
jgi:hypothetical protein